MCLIEGVWGSERWEEIHEWTRLQIYVLSNIGLAKKFIWIFSIGQPNTTHPPIFKEKGFKKEKVLLDHFVTKHTLYEGSNTEFGCRRNISPWLAMIFKITVKTCLLKTQEARGNGLGMTWAGIIWYFFKRTMGPLGWQGTNGCYLQQLGPV